LDTVKREANMTVDYEISNQKKTNKQVIKQKSERDLCSAPVLLTGNHTKL